MTLIFDGTYGGFLTAVFEGYSQKQWDVILAIEGSQPASLFEEEEVIITDAEKSKRITTALEKKLKREEITNFYKAFLSEDPLAWQSLYRILIRLFQGHWTLLDNFGDSDVLYFSQILKKVNRERHRMKAFIRFQKSNDGLYFALIAPDFNVLPLIIPFFKNRYADQKWLLYDEKRNYGILYDQLNIHEVVLEQEEQSSLLSSTAVQIALDERDALFQQLWKSYFKSTNIKARRNMKLHLQHVPKRYWRYLTEKQV